MSSLVQEFRDGLADGKLLIQKCNDCGTLALYPHYRCISCHSDNLGWQEAKGGGKLHTVTVVRAVPPAGFEDDLPYALGVVKLDEGVQLMTRLHPDPKTGDWENYKCETKVEFKPASADEIGRRAVAWFNVAGS